MKLFMSLFLGAAMVAGSAVAALAAPQNYQDEQTRQANTQAYSAGYSQGQADARSGGTRNNQPGSQWVSNSDQLAYTQGYDAGYNNVMNHASSAVGAPPLGPGDEQARQFGYQDGLAAGRADARNGDKFKPEDHDLYKNGLHGWTAALGTKDQFKQLYREAWMKGYEEGFRGTAPR
jgi:hypothetical protein